jgi:hypothetical protein
MQRRWWGGWKAQLAAGLVSVGLVATLLGIALAPRIRTHWLPTPLPRSRR